MMHQYLKSNQLSIFVDKMLLRMTLFFEDIRGNQDISDSILVQKILGGEKHFFEMLVNRYSQKLFRYLYHYFRFSKDTAEDVLQEIWMQVWQKLEKYNQEMKFESWIYSLSHNLCIDRMRKHSTTNQTFNNKMANEDGEILNIVDTASSPENLKDDINKKFKSELVKNILNKLDEDTKSLIVMYYFEQKSYDEISEIINKTPSTIRVQMHRAKEKLRELITNDGILSKALIFDLE